jgi:peroxiredoxin
MFRQPFFVFCAVLALPWAVVAGEYNPTLNIGDKAPTWKDLPGTEGKRHSLADLKDRDVVVVVFTCNSCPYAVDYEDRINELAKQSSGQDSRVAVVAINVNKIEADQMPAMKARAQEKNFQFPYLYDETQKIAREYGATWTPEFFVLDKDRRVVYMGAMDDNSDPDEVKVQYVAEAVKAALTGGKVAKAETPAVGCLIRFARERRR